MRIKGINTEKTGHAAGMALVLAAALLAGCASSSTSGSGSSGSGSSGSGSSGSGSSGSGSSGSGSSGSGGSGSGYTIAAPASASIGPNTPLAASGSTTPTFSSSGSTHPAIGTAFPLTQSALSFSSSGIAVDTAANSGGATATLQSLGNNSAVVEFKVPSLSLDASGVTTDGNNNNIAGGKVLTLDTNSLNYVLFGSWAVDASSTATAPSNAAYFISGYQTPASALPSGTATYSGSGSTNGGATAGTVTGVVAVPSGSSFANAQLNGTASLSVNFGTGAITGSLANMTATPQGGGTAAAWNGVNLTGTIAGGASTFSGTTAATGNPGGTYGLSSSATGVLNGAFYGPNGQEVGAVWSLHDGSGSSAKSALGVLSATKQ